MDCKNIQEQILSSKPPFPEDIDSHLKQCDKCRTLADEWFLLKDINLEKTENPPKAVDFIIQREAERFIENRNAQIKAFIRWVSLSTAAASIMLLSWFILSSLETTEKESADSPQITHNQMMEQPTHRPITSIPGTKSLNWNDLELSDDFFELETAIELNFASISQNAPNGDTEKYEDIYPEGAFQL